MRLHHAAFAAAAVDTSGWHERPDRLTVDVAGKSGTLFKTAKVSTDKGSKDLILRITILPPVVRTMTDADRARGLEMAKADRQAVFQR